MVIGVVYINPEGVRVAEMKRMYDKLKQEVRLREQRKMILMMGDFKGRIGAGRGGDEVINANGRRLLAWSTECNLAVLSTGDKYTGKWTWSIKDKQSTIDYMVVSKKMSTG